jgi:undecaprenyl-diphosphatase
VDASAYFIAALLGLVEGLTEFIPVSSTGHLILLVDLLGFRGPPGKVFEIAIQLGAILAVCLLYWRRLLTVARGLLTDRSAQRFATNILCGFLPAMVIGVLAHGLIKGTLFNPWVVSVMLVSGGIAILLIERYRPQPVVMHVDAITPGLALRIGLCQAVAMLPGVSRSGATIMGAMLLRVSREAATEFSFFLAIPTMLAATVYDLYKNWASLSLDDGALIATGFVSAFMAALVVVRTLIRFVSRNGFAPFAYYRIVIGALMIGLLLSR